VSPSASSPSPASRSSSRPERNEAAAPRGAASFLFWQGRRPPRRTSLCPPGDDPCPCSARAHLAAAGVRCRHSSGPSASWFRPPLQASRPARPFPSAAATRHPRWGAAGLRTSFTCASRPYLWPKGRVLPGSKSGGSRPEAPDTHQRMAPLPVTGNHSQTKSRPPRGKPAFEVALKWAPSVSYGTLTTAQKGSGLPPPCCCGTGRSTYILRKLPDLVPFTTLSKSPTLPTVWPLTSVMMSPGRTRAS
jgi:hypothetical protein